MFVVELLLFTYWFNYYVLTNYIYFCLLIDYVIIMGLRVGFLLIIEH
jgi:hypothetical protein